MTHEQKVKLDRLRSLIRDMGSLLVAYSGGVDSALVAAVAHEQLGDRALACIGVSWSYPQREQRDAIALLEKIGARYRLVETREQEIADYTANDTNRCYFCKTELYTRLAQLAQDEGFNAVADGIHADDMADHQHGMRAGRESAIRSPLLEAGIAKRDSRALAAHLHLPAWDKPAMACLSSRVPHGTPITRELLRQIESAEDVLADAGFRQFRVRHHGNIARVELSLDDLPKAIELREQIVEGIRAAGYRFVTLDLAGFRSGSVSSTDAAVPLMIHGKS